MLTSRANKEYVAVKIWKASLFYLAGNWQILAAESISTLKELMKTQDNIRGIDLTKSGESLDWKVKSNSFPAGPLSNATESKFSAGITWPENVKINNGKLQQFERGCEVTGANVSCLTRKYQDKFSKRFLSTRKLHNVVSLGSPAHVNSWSLKSDVLKVWEEHTDCGVTGGFDSSFDF